MGGREAGGVDNQPFPPPPCPNVGDGNENE
jgi:hypothetical protein